MRKQPASTINTNLEGWEDNTPTDEERFKNWAKHSNVELVPKSPAQ